MPSVEDNRVVLYERRKQENEHKSDSAVVSLLVCNELLCVLY